MEVGSVRNCCGDESSKVSSNDDAKIAEKKRAEKEDEKKRKREEDVLNPVDKNLIQSQTKGLGVSIAQSLVAGIVG